MPPLTTKQRQDLNQIMQVTGLAEKTATKVSSCYFLSFPTLFFGRSRFEKGKSNWRLTAPSLAIQGCQLQQRSNH